jgi:hypothetical protein
MHMLDAPLHSVFLTPSLLWVNQTDVYIYVTGFADPKSALFWEAGSAQSQNLGDAEDQNGAIEVRGRSHWRRVCSICSSGGSL